MIDFNEVEDEDLYEMCKRGDGDAWRYLYNYVLKICYWKKWNLPQPNDLAQDTVGDVHGAIDSVKDKKLFRPFIKKVAINNIIDSKNSTNRIESIDEPTTSEDGKEIAKEYSDNKPLSELILLELELVSIIDSGLEKMKEPCRKVLTVYFKFLCGEFESYVEISKALQMPTGTISSHVTRCLKKYREIREIKEYKLLLAKEKVRTL
jgi:RNA polymerase sigma factor (sigma-70 family)